MIIGDLESHKICSFSLVVFNSAAFAYNMSMQEDSEKAGKVTSAGMYFLHFQVYRMDSAVNAVYALH